MRISSTIKQCPENIETWQRAAQIVKEQGLDWTSSFYKANEEIRRKYHPEFAQPLTRAAPPAQLTAPLPRSWPTLHTLREQLQDEPNHDLAAYLASHAEFAYMKKYDESVCIEKLDPKIFQTFEADVPLWSKTLALIPVAALFAILVSIVVSIVGWILWLISPAALDALVAVSLSVWFIVVIAVASLLLLIYILSQKVCTFAYGYRDLDRIVLAFRGTNNRSELLLTDGNILPWGWPCRHLGFWVAWSSIRSQVTTWLESLDPRPVSLLFTGHSLGGALAQIAAFDLAGQYTIDAVITFGAPRPGFFRFRDSYEIRPASPQFPRGKTLGGVTHRYTHGTDLVSRIPPPIPYFHVGSEFYFDRNNEIQEGRPPDLIERLESGYNHLRGWLNYKLATPTTTQVDRLLGVPHGLATNPITKPHPLAQVFGPTGQTIGLGGSGKPFEGLDDLTKRLTPWIVMIPCGVVVGLIALLLFLVTVADALQHSMLNYLNAFGKRYSGTYPEKLLALGCDEKPVLAAMHTKKSALLE